MLSAEFRCKNEDEALASVCSQVVVFKSIVATVCLEVVKSIVASRLSKPSAKKLMFSKE